MRGKIRGRMQTLRRSYSAECAVGLNLLSTVGAVVMTKLLYREFAFAHSVLLTALQCLTVWAALLAAVATGRLTFRRLPWTEVALISLSFACVAGLGNVSLLRNSACTYQLSRALLTPALVAGNWAVTRRQPLWRVTSACVAVALGVAVAMAVDPDASWLGFGAAAAVLYAAHHHRLWEASRLADLRCSPAQLLLYEAPIAALVLLPASVLADDGLHKFYWPCASTAAALAAACAIGAVALLSPQLLVPCLPPGAAFALVRARAAAVVCAGWALVDNPYGATQVAGIATAFAGLCLFPRVKEKV